jgi:predicted DsbA family dithiol-disulfide isomerase
MPVTIDYFTDVLCIWAYGGQIRIDQLQKELGQEIRLQYRFIPLFAAAQDRLVKQWEHKGGLAGFNAHLSKVARQWEHVELHPSVWIDTAPETSTSAHLLLKAVQLLVEQGALPGASETAYQDRTLFDECVWRTREAFFRNCENIAERAVQDSILKSLEIPVNEVRAQIDNGRAFAALHLDDEAKQRYRVPGSPTLVLNEGRQLLYGNVGYRIIDVNVRELLHNPLHGEASWC